MLTLMSAEGKSLARRWTADVWFYRRR